MIIDINGNFVDTENICAITKVDELGDSYGFTIHFKNSSSKIWIQAPESATEEYIENLRQDVIKVWTKDEITKFTF